jgi:hypothetical protein
MGVLMRKSNSAKFRVPAAKVGIRNWPKYSQARHDIAPISAVREYLGESKEDAISQSPPSKAPAGDWQVYAGPCMPVKPKSELRLQPSCFDP